MSVRNAAAGNIIMLAANVRAEAEGFDSIGERGIGDRMKRTAAEIRLAAALLREFDGPAAYDIANGFAEDVSAIVESEVAPVPVAKFTVGQKVRTTNSPIYEKGTEFVITDVVAHKSLTDGGNYHVTGDQYGYGVWENHIEAVPEPLAAWEKELLGIKDDEVKGLKFAIGDKVKIVNDDEMAGHPVGTVGVIVDTDEGDVVEYEVQAENTSSWTDSLWHTESALELVTEPEPKPFVVPSRVRVLSTSDNGSEYTTPYIGQLGTLVSVGQPYVQVQLDIGRFLYLSKEEFEVI